MDVVAGLERSSKVRRQGSRVRTVGCPGLAWATGTDTCNGGRGGWCVACKRVRLVGLGRLGNRMIRGGSPLDVPPGYAFLTGPTGPTSLNWSITSSLCSMLGLLMRRPEDRDGGNRRRDLWGYCVILYFFPGYQGPDGDYF